MTIRPAAGVLVGLALSSTIAAAQTNIPSPRITPVRPEFTRPGGLPGAAREIAPDKSQYLMAVPTEEPRVTPVAKKKKK